MTSPESQPVQAAPDTRGENAAPAPGRRLRKPWGDVLRGIAAACCGFLLWAAFPPLENWESAWVALIPLLLMAHVSRPAVSFRWGWLGGMVFWLLSLSWLLRLSRTGGWPPLVALGWVALSAYCALYVGAFAAAAAFLMRRLTAPDRGPPWFRNLGIGRLLLVIVLPAVWCGLEHIRGTWFTGFGWNTLGVSQFRNPAVIQWAAWGGVYAVSAPMVALNAALALTAIDIVPGFGTVRRRLHPELLLGLVMASATWIGGARMAASERAAASRTKRDTVKVAAVQPAIPQRKKWTADAVDRIYRELETQTRFAELGRPELIVWPETALPASLPNDSRSLDFVRDVADRTPLLVGSMEATPETSPEEPAFSNSVFLFDADGRIRQVYRKVHLVPFGEYIPFDRHVPLLKRMAPLGFSCRAGREITVFRLPDRPEAAFSSLICFEDTIPSLAREAVGSGARFLVNQTNDAWFDGTVGPLQHLSQCVFRSVENRVDTVRVANTGVTCHIDAAGRIVSVLSDGGNDRTPVAGFALYAVGLRPSNRPPTPYGRGGDLLFGVPCQGVTLALGAWALLHGIAARRRERKDGDGGRRTS